jgi:hypothetical protein
MTTAVVAAAHANTIVITTHQGILSSAQTHCRKYSPYRLNPLRPKQVPGAMYRLGIGDRGSTCVTGCVQGV